MSKINRINSISECPPDGRVIVEYCNRQSKFNPNIQTRNGKGDHAVVRTEKGACAVPLRQIGKGLFCQIIKALIAIGISAIVIAIVAIANGWITI